MSKSVSYVSKSNKRYNIPKRKKLNMKAWILFLIIPSILIVLLSLFLLYTSSKFNSDNIFVSYYAVSGRPSYKIYLKDYTQYPGKSYLDEKYSPPADLISTINPDFRFQFGSNDVLDITYTYKVTGYLVMKNSSDGLVNDRDFVLLSPKTETVKASSFQINENIAVDYDEYKNIVNDFKREKGMTVDSDLTVTFSVLIEAKYNDSEEVIKKEYLHTVRIPLSELTVKVDVTSSDINDEGSLGVNIPFEIENPILFIIGCVLLIVGLLLVGLSIYLFVVFRKKNIYSITLKKLLNEYDRLIVNGVVKGDGFDESNYDKMIEVKEFSELVDAASNLNANILFYEVIPGEEAYFILTNDDVMYKFKLTKAYLQGASERGEKGY